MAPSARNLIDIDLSEFDAIAFSVDTLGKASIAIFNEGQGPLGLTVQQIQKNSNLIVATLGPGREPIIPDLAHIQDKQWSNTWQTVAVKARDEFSGMTIAVTGSAGKSSVHSMIVSALTAIYDQRNILSTKGNQNLLPGVKRTLSALRKHHQYVVQEVAVSHAPQSASILRPNIALLTNISEAHLVWHKSLEEIADFKSAVFRYLEPQGTAVICRDTELFERVRMHASRPDLKIITYGTHADADWRLEQFDPLTGEANYVFESQPVTLNIKAGSQHQAVNLAGALACMAAAGEDWRGAAGHLKNWSPMAGRGVSFSIQTNDGSRALVVDDAFNAAPIAMKAAIKALAERKEAKRRVLVLGEMLELGGASKELHTRLAEVVAAHSIDCVYAVGEVYDEFWEQLPVCRRGKHVATRKDLHLSILADARDGDIWWIKGAHGSGLHYEVTKLHAMKIV